jgi:D-alanyl-D-alanine carboxypeptidase (penicillin-binding protein 5/6)
VVLAVLAPLALPPAAAAPAKVADKAASSILMDAASGTLLLATQPDAPFPPSDFSMLMTLDVAFDAIANHKLSLDQMLPISLHAWRTGGGPAGVSAMFAKVNSEVAVHDLLRGVAVDIGHDAAIALAEGIAGSEPAFVRRMNARAAALGMTHSRFTSASGLPAGGTTTARDLAVLARDLVTRFPDLYKIFAEPDFAWNRIDQRNRNPLITARGGLSPYDGADGLLAGAHENGGRGIVASALRAGQRLIVVATGLPDKITTAKVAAALLNRGFNGFAPRKLFEAGAVVASARVFGGTTGSVPLMLHRAVTVPVPTGGHAHLIARVTYRGPVRAPVAAGARIATLQIWRDDLLQAEVPLSTTKAVPVGRLWQRALDATTELAAAAVRLVVGQL